MEELIKYAIFITVAYIEFFALVHVVGKSIGDYLHNKKHN